MTRCAVLACVALSLAACADGPLTCGEGTNPVVVSGLNGTLEPSGEPAVEMLSRIPETCARLDTAWIVLDESDNTLRVVADVAAERIDRSLVRPVDGDPNAFEILTRNLLVQLVYPDGVGPAPTVEVVWTAAEELGRVACAAEGQTLRCE